MKIFVTGATGFLGYHFVNAAVNQGHKLLCLKRASSQSLFDQNVDRQIQWVLDDENLEKIATEFKPEILFHAAWGGVRGTDRNNADLQTLNLTMSMRMFSLYTYSQIIAIGSQAEYGYYKDIVRENHPLNPTMEYAKAKVKCSQSLQQYCEDKGIEWQWIRVFTVFGENQTGGLIKTAIDKCLSGETTFNTTEGNQKYSYLYARDFAKAICNVLGTKGKSGIYNLSQPHGLHSNREILKMIKQNTGSNIKLNFGIIPYTDHQVMLMDGIVDKFEQAFGKIPYSNFEQSIDNTINHAKKLNIVNRGGGNYSQCCFIH